MTGHTFSECRISRVAAAIALGALVAACVPTSPILEAVNEAAPEATAASDNKPVSTPAAKRGARGIVVRDGQSLSRIAAEYDIPQRAIIAANQLTPPYKIKTGQTVMLPGDDQQPTPANRGRSVVVGAGQSLSRIAAEYHMPQAAIVTANQLTPPYKIKIGQRLLVPDPEKPMTPPAISSLPEAVPSAGEKTPKTDISAASNPSPGAASLSAAPSDKRALAETAVKQPEPAPLHKDKPALTAAVAPLNTGPLPTSNASEPPATKVAAVLASASPDAAAAPPGVSCPAGTVGKWSDKDVTRIPVYICSRSQSQQ